MKCLKLVCASQLRKPCCLGFVVCLSVCLLSLGIGAGSTLRLKRRLTRTQCQLECNCGMSDMSDRRPRKSTEEDEWHGPKACFISFGAGPFEASAERIEAEARRVGIFDEIHVYDHVPKFLRDDPKWRPHLTNGPNGGPTRGYGYWFWKSALINYTLNTLREDDVLVYLDAGCQFGNGAVWAEYLHHLCGHDMIAHVLHHGAWNEASFTKGDIFEAFGTSFLDDTYNGTQISATYMTFRNNARTRRFLDLWVGLVADYHLVSDQQSAHPNSLNFYDNRHDQSLFSMLVKSNKPSFTSSAWQDMLTSGPHPPSSEWPMNPVFGVPGLRPIVLSDVVPKGFEGWTAEDQCRSAFVKAHNHGRSALEHITHVGGSVRHTLPPVMPCGECSSISKAIMRSCAGGSKNDHTVVEHVDN